jgi:enterochelin esterase family protein
VAQATDVPTLDQLGSCSAEELDSFIRSARPPLSEAGRFLFVYRTDDHGADRVVLHHSLAGYRRPPALERIGTAVFGLWFSAPTVDRLEYELEVVAGETRHYRLDPLNPLQVAGPFGNRSVAIAPGYAEPLYAQPPPADAVGRLEAHEAPLFIEKRHGRWVRHRGELLIWHPPGADAMHVLPIVVFLDGPEFVQFAAARRALENLVHEGRLAPCRAVFIPPVERNRQYAAEPDMARYLGEDLGAVLEPLLPIPASPEQRIGVGASLGALALLHSYATTSGFLGRLLLQSGSYFQQRTDPDEQQFPYYERITRFVGAILSGEQPVAPTDIVMACGSGGENLANNRRMLQALRAGGSSVRFITFRDAHTWTGWRDSLGAGLMHRLPSG